MITLNNRTKINKSKIRVGRGIGSGKGKTSGRGVKHSKINICLYIIIMKTISIFMLLIYWSIMIFAPVMSKDIKFSRAKTNNIKLVEVRTGN